MTNPKCPDVCPSSGDNRVESESVVKVSHRLEESFRISELNPTLTVEVFPVFSDKSEIDSDQSIRYTQNVLVRKLVLSH